MLGPNSFKCMHTAARTQRNLNQHKDRTRVDNMDAEDAEVDT